MTSVWLNDDVAGPFGVRYELDQDGDVTVTHLNFGAGWEPADRFPQMDLHQVAVEVADELDLEARG